MKSALILFEDENLLNRIKVTLHDDAASFYYVDSADEAVAILNETEIAVALIPYRYDVLDGDELIGMLLDNNPKLQIVLFFNEEDMDNVVKSHNTYHLCKLICTNNLMLEELNQILNEAFNAYNKEELIKKMEIDYRKKEDSFKKTLFASSSLLNDRMAGYDSIEKLFGICTGYLFDQILASDDENKVISHFFDELLDEYISLMLKREPELEKYYAIILEKCHNPSENRYFMIDIPSITEFDKVNHDIFLQITFLIKAMSMFCFDFYKKFRGKAELSESKNSYILDIIFEGVSLLKDSDTNLRMEAFLKKLSGLYANKVSCGKKERIIQYRLQFSRL